MIYCNQVINKIFGAFVGHMDQYLNLTTQEIQQKFKLPKIAAKKIEQANQFINNPSSTLRLILEKNIQRNLQSSSKDENFSTSKKNVSHLKLNNIQKQEIHPQMVLIAEKMKKYKPVNGSFSQLYAEQLSIDSNREKRPEIANINQFKNLISNKINPNRQKRRKNLSSQSFQKSQQAFIQKPYLRKLKLIRQKSDIVRENSREILQRADTVVIINENNFEKLAEDSHRILSGQQKFELDQIFSRQQKNLGIAHFTLKSSR